MRARAGWLKAMPSNTESRFFSAALSSSHSRIWVSRSACTVEDALGAARYLGGEGAGDVVDVEGGAATVGGDAGVKRAPVAAGLRVLRGDRPGCRRRWRRAAHGFLDQVASQRRMRLGALPRAVAPQRIHQCDGSQQRFAGTLLGHAASGRIVMRNLVRYSMSASSRNRADPTPPVRGRAA